MAMGHEDDAAALLDAMLDGGAVRPLTT